MGPNCEKPQEPSRDLQVDLKCWETEPFAKTPQAFVSLYFIHLLEDYVFFSDSLVLC